MNILREIRLGIKIFGKVKVAPVVDKSVSVRSYERLTLVGLRRGRGRLKKYWGEVIR